MKENKALTWLITVVIDIVRAGVVILKITGVVDWDWWKVWLIFSTPYILILTVIFIAGLIEVFGERGE